MQLRKFYCVMKQLVYSRGQNSYSTDKNIVFSLWKCTIFTHVCQIKDYFQPF